MVDERELRDDSGDDVERLLRTLAPERNEVDRDAIMFAAGASSVVRQATRGRTHLRLWQAATVLLGLSTGLLSWGRFSPGNSAGELADSRANGPREVSSVDPVDPRARSVDFGIGRTDEAESPDLAEGRRPRDRSLGLARATLAISEWTGEATSDDGFLAIRRTALTRGVEALPQPVTTLSDGSDDVTYGRLRERLSDFESDRG